MRQKRQHGLNKINALRAEMRKVRQQRAIPLAAFDQMAYDFCHNAVLRPRSQRQRLRGGEIPLTHA